MKREPLSRRTFQKVRRDSCYPGNERDLWRPTNAAEMRQALRAAERYEVKHKPKGKRNGPLGHVALEVYRALWNRIRFTDGRLDPSIAWLMRQLGRSRAAIVAALARLRTKGFLRWIRRIERIDGAAGERGPQVRQMSNAYALDVPEAARALAAAVVLPDDERARREAIARIERDWKQEEFDRSPLGKALATYEAAMRKSASLPSRQNPSLSLSLKSEG